MMKRSTVFAILVIALFNQDADCGKAKLLKSIDKNVKEQLNVMEAHANKTDQIAQETIDAIEDNLNAIEDNADLIQANANQISSGNAAIEDLVEGNLDGIKNVSDAVQANDASMTIKIGELKAKIDDILDGVNNNGDVLSQHEQSMLDQGQIMVNHILATDAALKLKIESNLDAIHNQTNQLAVHDDQILSQLQSNFDANAALVASHDTNVSAKIQDVLVAIQSISSGNLKTYHLVSSPMTFESAAANCKNVYGPLAHLAEPMNERENSAIYEQVTSDYGGHLQFWIGIHDQDIEATFVYDSNNKSITYSNWGSGQGLNTTGALGEDCATIGFTTSDPLLWYDRPCTISYASVCQVDSGISWVGEMLMEHDTSMAAKILDNFNAIQDIKSSLSMMRCYMKSNEPEKIFSVNGKCYYLETSPMNYTSANENCQQLFGYASHPAEPMTSNENNAIYDNVKAIYGGHLQFWIGIHDSTTEGEWVYQSTGLPITYSNWEASQPNGGSANEDHVTIGYNSNKPTEWFDRYGTDSLASVCQF